MFATPTSTVRGKISAGVAVSRKEEKAFRENGSGNKPHPGKV